MSASARLTVFAPDVPYPPHRGGRADVWRRLLALRGLGVAVQLVCFYDDEPGKRPSDAELATLRAVVDDLLVFPIRKGPWRTAGRLLHLASMPSHVSSRRLQAAELAGLRQRVIAHAPDHLWAEGPWCGDTVLKLSRACGIPMAYRSHNIEHLYLPRQAAAARRTRDRIAWTLAGIGLQRYERRMIRHARHVFDISADDLAYWQGQGVQHASWLPPLAESALTPQALEANANAPAPTLDVLYLGNLTTPNNIRGVEWLVLDILPIVQRLRPGTRLVVAGSRPGAHVQALCTAAGVELQADVPDALALYRQARVLVNPVRTGSGTHVKAIEMLMMRSPIVTATQGTRGLPETVKRLFRVADSSEDFARHIVAALADPVDAWAERAQARRLFGPDSVRAAIDRLSRSRP